MYLGTSELNLEDFLQGVKSVAAIYMYLGTAARPGMARPRSKEGKQRDPLLHTTWFDLKVCFSTREMKSIT